MLDAESIRANFILQGHTCANKPLLRRAMFIASGLFTDHFSAQVSCKALGNSAAGGADERDRWVLGRVA